MRSPHKKKLRFEKDTVKTLSKEDLKKIAAGGVTTDTLTSVIAC